MKKLKSMSIIMATLVAAQAGMNYAVFAMEANGTAEGQGNVAESDQSVGTENKKMKEQINKELLRAIFFRPELIKVVKNFLPNKIQKKNMPSFCCVSQFSKFLSERGIEVEGISEKNTTKEENKQEERVKRIIQKDNLNLLQKEIKNNMNIVIKDSFFEVQNMKIPILHYCVMKKAIKCFKFLLLNGADPSTTLLDESGHKKYEWDCMSIAICFGEWEMMKILEERGINKLNNPSVWEAAALTHRNNLLKLFISNKDQIDSSLFKECLKEAMFGAAKVNNLKGLTALFEQRVDINAKDGKEKTPLHIAAEEDAVESVKLLMSKGADVNAENGGECTPLDVAMSNHAARSVELLISEVADINAGIDERESLLFDLLDKDFGKAAEILINKGVDVNAKNYEGSTPLHFAVSYEKDKLAKLLISKGANVNAKNYEGSTPLHWAVDAIEEQNCELLISKGADINAKDNNGRTPLHIAAGENSLEMAELLMENGADINAEDNDGQTPLYYAARHNESELAEFLISKGADVNVKDNYGRTPLSSVRGGGTLKMIKLLKSNGAK